MGCEAVLTKVIDQIKIKAKLPAWTDDDPEEIIADVKKGKSRLITTIDCYACKEDLEEDNAAEVVVEVDTGMPEAKVGGGGVL